MIVIVHSSPPHPKVTQHANCLITGFSPGWFTPRGTLRCESLQQNKKDKTKLWYRAKKGTLQHVKLLCNWEFSEDLSVPHWLEQ